MAIANAKLAYQSYKEIFRGDDWEESRRPALAAALPVGVDLDQEPRLPRPHLRGGAGRPRDRQHDAPRDDRGAAGPRPDRSSTLERDVDEARRTFDRLAEVGVDYDDVVAVLEREGVEKFADSFNELIEGVAGKRDQFTTA